MFYFNPEYLLFALPAFLLGLWAQMRIQIAYSQAQQRAAPLSGAAAARHILDSAGVQNVEIESIPALDRPLRFACQGFATLRGGLSSCTLAAWA